jgi:aspartate/tyrosine/aromatic aminotransferase
VATILEDPDLHGLWVDELGQMRQRIHDMRSLLVSTMKRFAPGADFDFLRGQRGMFSFSGLTAQQVEILRKQYAIYIVGAGRINVAGITPQNVERLCQAIASVL